MAKEVISITADPNNKNTVNKFTLRVTNAKIKDGLNSLRPALSKVVDAAIRKHAKDFIPSDEQAIELGVGDFQGGLDRHRLLTAWSYLLLDGPDEGTKVTALTITTRRGSGARVSRIKVNILEEGFLSLPINNLEIESVELPVIPWMEWFLNGSVIGGFKFSNKPPISNTSRTGGGIMIDGGLWSFPPQGLGLFREVINTIDRDLHTKMKALLQAAVQKSNAGA